MKAITRSFLTLRYVLATIQSPSKCTKELQNLTPHWSSSITKRYKRNAIHGDLCRAEFISSDLNNNKMLIRQKFDNAVYRSSFNFLIFSPLLSSEIMSISRIRDKTNKMSSSYHLIFLKFRKNRYWCSFHIGHRMSS